MIFRTATFDDIKEIQRVRHLVKENRLSNPALVTDEDVAFYITKKGRGWVSEVDGQIIGFAIIDLLAKSVWGLFVAPEFAEMGIGKELHRLMMNWYFEQTRTPVVLGTAANTRAERFYELQGWEPVGTYPNGEIKFEMTYEGWSDHYSFQ